jgi:hypothetical protein
MQNFWNIWQGKAEAFDKNCANAFMLLRTISVKDYSGFETGPPTRAAGD